MAPTGCSIEHMSDAVWVAIDHTSAVWWSAPGLTPRWSDEIPGTLRCHIDDPFGNRIELIDGGADASR